MAAGLSGQDR